MRAEQLMINSSNIIIICTIDSASPPPPTELEYPDYYNFYVPNVCTKKLRFCNTLHSAQLLEENTNGEDAMINAASLLLMLLALPLVLLSLSYIIRGGPQTLEMEDQGKLELLFCNFYEKRLEGRRQDRHVIF